MPYGTVHVQSGLNIKDNVGLLAVEK